MDGKLPKKMTSEDKFPRKPIANNQGKSNRKAAKKDRKSPPEATARKSNMSSDSSSNYESDGDTARDKDLEKAQNDTFGRKRPSFQNLKSEEKKNLKSLEKEKEEGEIQPANDNDAGQYSPEEYKAWQEANMDKFLEVKSKQHICAFVQESVRKPYPKRPKW